jgi:hypothetical protein
VPLPLGNHGYLLGFIAGKVLNLGRYTSDRAAAICEHQPKQETEMPRKAGDRYVCEKCGAKLVYEKPCPCPEGMPHSEICCGQQMKLDQVQAATKTR